MKTLNEGGKVVDAKATYTGLPPEPAVPSAGLPGSKPDPAETKQVFPPWTYAGGYGAPGDHVVDPLTGAWKRMTIADPMPYDRNYVVKYDKSPYRETSEELSELRLSLVLKYCDTFPARRLLDWGCGAGHFLKCAQSHAARTRKLTCQGYDISGYEPKGVKMLAPGMPFAAFVAEFQRTKPFNIVTCFDSLEHVEHPRELLKVIDGAKHLVISVPWCHGATLGHEWFKQWRHNKPREHWWYFDPASLCNLLSLHGYRPVFIGNPEDEVRRGPDQYPNILTGVFRKG